MVMALMPLVRGREYASSVVFLITPFLVHITTLWALTYSGSLMS